MTAVQPSLFPPADKPCPACHAVRQADCEHDRLTRDREYQIRPAACPYQPTPERTEVPY